ncbi:hypothetical protein DPSP01_013692 [Paraphaeosphaeria sporulosa]
MSTVTAPIARLLFGAALLGLAYLGFAIFGLIVLGFAWSQKQKQQYLHVESQQEVRTGDE